MTGRHTPQDAERRRIIADASTGLWPAGLPRIGSVSVPQQRGMACVWCARTLDDATAVGLGARTFRDITGPATWYPRACPGCAP